MENPYSELIAKYRKMLDIIDENSEQGAVCPELCCVDCPMFFDEHSTGICLFTLQGKLEKTIATLERCILEPYLGR